MAYNIIFYENENGKSEIWNFLENLRKKSATNKDARIQYKQAILYIKLLQNNGTMLPDTITKHIDENIWELRPGNNRIFYFYCDENNFILLHHFRKKTQKTPRREIAKAKAERDDYLSQKEKNDYEKLE
ncbi:MAG: type II toxin-antitoxin system RelE/ParE family toxin [Lachnospiraceae bacterium]|nr:type II toxin-antitoxin system RelE/ParE family toxin [Lachnospiraceae bacterium]